MGCDFFWEGSIPLNELQERTVRFVLSYFVGLSTEDLVTFEPSPGLRLPTLANNRDFERIIPDHPFNYYGVAPYYKDKRLRDRMQFVFDRSDFGRIVSMEMTPESRNDDDAIERERRKQGVQVSIRDVGHQRTVGGGGSALALLLNIVRMRYCPNLDMSDDYGYCEGIEETIEAWGLTSALRINTLDFNGCCELYDGECDKRHPSPPAPPRLSLVKEKHPKIHPITPEESSLLVEGIEMSVRTETCLRRAGIRTVGDLVQHTSQDLLRIENFGRKSLLEILKMLRLKGLELQEDNE